MEEEITELQKLKVEITSQNSEALEINHYVRQQADRLNELRPENQILKYWIEELTHFTQVEINHVVRLEKVFPTTMDRTYSRIKHKKRPCIFKDFVESAKEVALDYLEIKLAPKQVQILRRVELNTLSIDWGKLDTYVEENLVLVPKDVQNLFAEYLYKGTREIEEKLIMSAKAALALWITDEFNSEN